MAVEAVGRVLGELEIRTRKCGWALAKSRGAGWERKSALDKIQTADGRSGEELGGGCYDSVITGS